MQPRVISVTEFKAKCLALLDGVNENFDELVITKRGKAIARVVPVNEPPSLLGTVHYDMSDDEFVKLGLDWDPERWGIVPDDE